MFKFTITKEDLYNSELMTDVWVYPDGEIFYTDPPELKSDPFMHFVQGQTMIEVSETIYDYFGMSQIAVNLMLKILEEFSNYQDMPSYQENKIH